MPQIGITEGTTSSFAGVSQVPSLIQNLGPGVLYLDFNSNVHPDNGTRLAAGESLVATPSSGLYGLSSDDDCDVRILATSTGIYK